MDLRRFLRLVENGLATIMDVRPNRPALSQAALATRLSNDLPRFAAGERAGERVGVSGRGYVRNCIVSQLVDDPM